MIFQWQRVFLLFLLIPTLIYGMGHTECLDIYDYKIHAEWEQHTRLIQQFQLNPYSEWGLEQLKKSIECCQRAVTQCDRILNDIASQSKLKRRDSWRVAFKSLCEEDKKKFNAEIDQLKFEMKRIEVNLSALALYKRSLEKIEVAKNKECGCQRLSGSTDRVVAILNEVAVLYEEAASLVNEALILIHPYPQETDKADFKKHKETNQETAKKYRNEAKEWPFLAAADCRKKIAVIEIECDLLTQKGLQRACYDLQKHALSLVEQALYENSSKEATAVLKEEYARLEKNIINFEKKADSYRLTNILPFIGKKEFKNQEIKRRESFFKNSLHPALYLSKVVKNALSKVVPLDGQTGLTEGTFSLYTDQFYRFLIHNVALESELVVKVLENGQVIHIETIDLPFKNPAGWQQYLKGGMVFIPDTKLNAEFGFQLRLRYSADLQNMCSLIVYQKGTDVRYQFAISLSQEEPLYTSTLLTPPPWQLETLKKPVRRKPNQAFYPSTLPNVEDALKGIDKHLFNLELECYPILDQFVEEHKNDPLALASYVHNEIALVDPFVYQENGVFHPFGIQKNPSRTFLEKQGSAWEQCNLLVYLLRKAGFQAEYALADMCSLPKDFVERMLLTKMPDDQQEALLKYPWVVFFNGNAWVSLFPWMKEMQVEEGHDLYSFLPEKYATADRWILNYLKSDEEILKHIGPDGDDTVGVLFVRFVEEHLQKQGLSLDDLGIHCTQLKKQFYAWEDFPHPIVRSQPRIYNSLRNFPDLYLKMTIEIRSRQNTQKCISYQFPTCVLETETSFVRFGPHGNMEALFAEIGGRSFILPLDGSDQIIDIAMCGDYSLGATKSAPFQATCSIHKGTSAALCAHFGSNSSKVISQCYEKFKNEKNEKKKLLALLSFVGASYFEKCSRSANSLAALHKVNPATYFAFGLAKLSPDLSKGPFRDEGDLVFPQVDMHFFHVGVARTLSKEMQAAQAGFDALFITDTSSNEHQILREVFKDPYAVSTVKLLQLSHLNQQKQGLEGDGFLNFTPVSFKAANENPQAAQKIFFPNMKDFNLAGLKEISSEQWNALKTLIDPNNPWSYWAYAYMTPGSVSSLDGARKEMGAMVISPYTWHALISINNIVANGGLGARLPSYYLTPLAIRNWDLIRLADSCSNGYALSVPTQPNGSQNLNQPSFLEKPAPPVKVWTSDVRPWYKSAWNNVCDPVDTVTGAFYLDETDLILPGPFSLSIRRNYNSKNALIGDLGCGWKLSLNPFLIDQDGKRFVAELDGTVLVYSYNCERNRWEVLPENNPELSNFNQQGIGSSASPFHAYIENDVLYAADGSKRFYKNGLLQKSLDVRGNALFFSYKAGRLSRIESCNGDFCGIHYNHEGNISEIYARDGRHISYEYDSQANLVKVILPNSAVIRYTYDRYHRIIRETKPHGKLLENVYDDEGRVIEQRSPMGHAQGIVTTATFEYAADKTVVTDATGGKTTYQIHNKQIYKITDPLGFTTLQAWFIDQKSWFDPATETVTEWNQTGGAFRSLKSSTDKRGLTTSYLYDSQSNAERITVKGEDLTGASNGRQQVTKTLTYNAKNLCIQEEMNGQKTITTYDSAFVYLPKRIERYAGDTLNSYTELYYNSLGQLEKEDKCGSVTLWKYNDRGLPCETTQVTGTEDPDVTTTYVYNSQGQCIQIHSADGVQKNTYDIMGNQIESKTFSHSGELLSAYNIGYDLNNAPIWKQTANPENVVYLDYNATGAIKAKRQALIPSSLIAYTLYEYNPCGYLIEEIDPRGYITYRDYDLLGRVKKETKEGHTTLFTYEAGGLPATITSASGAQVTRYYTTNGLLKEEIYPDGTKSQSTYDLLGRLVLETKNGIAWEIEYDDVQHRVTRTHVKTKDAEISEFDLQGNLICFTDAACYSSEKTYDLLGRIKTETSPSGQQTRWSYQGDRVICTLPNGETKTTYFAGGQAVKIEVTDSSGALIAHSTMRFDPEKDTEEVIQGDKRTVTWLNVLGLPVKIEKGNCFAQHEYDAAGNCICSIDGDGRVTRQEFDGLGRVVKKHLPDGSLIGFVYDVESNLTEYHLPNGTTWKASYDLMGRKTAEELFSSSSSCGRRTFSYEDGHLVRATDPMLRTHTYLYDLHGRLSEDKVEGGVRRYIYEPRGYLTTVEQIVENAEKICEKTRVERSYDPDGNLSLESTYLNEHLIQQTKQTWTANSLSLQIGSHARDCIYQNNQLLQVSIQHVGMAYSYDLGGFLTGKNHPLNSNLIGYNAAGQPESILTWLPERPYQEQLEWYPSGKLLSHTAPESKQDFSYNERGYLTSTGSKNSENSENYEFDFGSLGTGVLTGAPGWYVSQEGLDEFSKILSATFRKNTLTTAYNPIGEVITHGQKHLSWDPWGRLIKITDPGFVWEASYDALGRRLQTRYTKARGQTVVTNSLYDPNEEFQEIGVQIDGKTFWKIYGPDGCCDAITDETGASINLVHNALRQLTAVVSCQGICYSEKMPSAYGFVETSFAASNDSVDLVGYAHSLSWHSKSQDPTGFMWMGDRYYDSRAGMFLSQDSVSYPICLDLYTYANGDPINYFDPDGRFASPVYEPIKATVLSAWSNPRVHGSLQALGGLTEVYGGVNLAATPFGWAMITHGVDNVFAGGYTMVTGHPRETATEMLLQKTGMSSEWASLANDGLGLTAPIVAGGRIVCKVAFRKFTGRNARENLKRFHGTNPTKTIEAHHVFPQEFEKEFLRRGINVHYPEYLTWVEKNAHSNIHREGYNAAWELFFDTYPKATKAQALEEGKRIMDLYGISSPY